MLTAGVADFTEARSHIDCASCTNGKAEVLECTCNLAYVTNEAEETVPGCKVINAEGAEENVGDSEIAELKRKHVY